MTRTYDNIARMVGEIQDNHQEVQYIDFGRMMSKQKNITAIDSVLTPAGKTGPTNTIPTKNNHRESIYAAIKSETPDDEIMSTYGIKKMQLAGYKAVLSRNINSN